MEKFADTVLAGTLVALLLCVGALIGSEMEMVTTPEPAPFVVWGTPFAHCAVVDSLQTGYPTAPTIVMLSCPKEGQ